VGVREKSLVTSCTLVVVPNLTRGGLPYGLIENVVTSSKHRKQGYGAAVLKHAFAEAWKHGCYKIMLLTGSKTPATLKFYEGVGFEQNKTGFQIRRLPG
jgi:GNAT superfamily N-acetyltransferase